jgi:hypothetical protein
MKNKLTRYLIGKGTEIAVMLLLVSVFFALFTTLLFMAFPAGITLTQILEQRSGRGGDLNGRASGGAVFDLQQKGVERAAATLSHMGNEVRSKGAASIAWGPAEVGMRLHDHDAIQTFTQSSAQISFDRTNYVTMGSNSLVIIKRIEKEAARNERRSSIVVVDGQLQARVGSAGGDKLHLNIATPSATVKMLPQKSARAKGDFKISVNPDHSSTIVVLRGEAAVSAQGKTVRVAQNRGVMVKQGEAPMEVIELPPPPLQMTPANGAVIQYRELPQRVGLKWGAGTSGNRYHLQLARDRAFKEMVIDKELAEPQFQHGNLKQGTYYWRISRVDRGVEGTMSGASRFQMLRNGNPPPLRVSFPAAPVPEERFTLSGSTAPGCRVFVKGKPVATDERGGFSCEVPIKKGITLVTVEAIDASGNVAYQSHYVQGSLDR